MKNQSKPQVRYTVVVPDKGGGYVVIEEDIATLKQAREIMKASQLTDWTPQSYEIWKETTTFEVVHKSSKWCIKRNEAN